MFILFYYAVTYIVAEEKYSQKNIEVYKLNHGKKNLFFLLPLYLKICSLLLSERFLEEQT